MTMDKTEIMALADRLATAPTSWLPSTGPNGEDVINITFTFTFPERDAISTALRLAAGASAGALKVCNLDWGEPYLNEIGETAVSAHSSCGRYIASDHGWFLCGLTQWNEAADIDAAKVAAQADYEQRIRSALTPEPVKVGDEVMRWRHKKRGTTYAEIGRGKIQAEKWIDLNNDNEHKVDMREVVIYRADADGSLWVRPREEFEDGRFEALSTTAPQPDNGARGNVVAMREALEDIEALGRHLRQGGPDPMDLQDLSDALDDAVNFAATALDLAAANQSDVEALAATTAERPGTVTSEPEPSTSDPAPAEPVAWHVEGHSPFTSKRVASNYSTAFNPPQPLYLHPPRSVDVEAIARVIDPQAWRDRDYYNDYRRLPASEHPATKSSLAKARSIAAMIKGE